MEGMEGWFENKKEESEKKSSLGIDRPHTDPPPTIPYTHLLHDDLPQHLIGVDCLFEFGHLLIVGSIAESLFRLVEREVVCELVGGGRVVGGRADKPGC